MVGSLIPDGVLPNVAAICAEVVTATGVVRNVWGGGPDKDHNNHRCIDYMITNHAQGEKVAAYHLANRDRLGVQLIIWNRRIIRGYDKPGIPAWTWVPYTGSKSHTDHNHVQYADKPYQPPPRQEVVRMKIGDEVRVTAKSGLWAKSSPTGKQVKVRPYGFTFVVTKLQPGWASGGSFWYSTEYLTVVKPTERIPFRGRLVCDCVATSLPLVEKAMIKAGVIKYSIDIWQAGYNKGGVEASAGTHDRGGVIDVGQYSTTALTIWRLWGWAMQARTRAQGFSPHGHGWPKGCPHLSSGAAYQASEWQNGRNGLRDRRSITGPGPIGRSTPTWTQAIKTLT